MSQAQSKMQPIPGADPTQVDSNHYQVALENDKIRVLRISYGPGERSVMHGHPPSLALLTTNAQIRFTFPDGRSEDLKASVGDVVWVEAGDHLPENLGGGRLEATLVELKTPASLGEQIGDERGSITAMRVTSRSRGPGSESRSLVPVRRRDSRHPGDRHWDLLRGDPARWSALRRGSRHHHHEGWRNRDMERQWRGRPTGRGSAVSWRGAVYDQSSSERLRRLNGVAGIFEHETDENGNTIGRTYEWKCPA